MGRSTKIKISEKVKRAPKGKLFLISDFAEQGSDKAVRKSLRDLEQSNQLNRVYLGIYQKPNYNETLHITIPASPMEIAEAIARKNKWTIAPAKDLALNMLGLDTQIPNTYAYISDGPSRKITLDDGRIISFRHVTQRESLLSPTSSLVVEAFKSLGQDNVTDKILMQVKAKLTPSQLKQLTKDTASSRVWIREKVKMMNGDAK